MKTLYQKQLLTVFLSMGTALFCITVAVLSISQQYVMSEIYHKTQKNAQFLGAYTSSYLQNNVLSNPEFQAYVKNIALVSDSFISVTPIDSTDSYATDGENFYPIRRNEVSRSVVAKITELGEYETYSDLGGIFTEERYVYGVNYTKNVNGEVVPMGFVVISPNTESITVHWETFGGAFAALVMSGVFLTMVLVAGFARWQTKPLKELTQTAEQFGKGDLAVRLSGYENRKDETGELIRHFNLMASSIARVEEYRSSFISNLSHELKTPMTAISGYAEGLLDGTVPVQKRDKALEIIQKETRRLARLVQQMLDISRMEVEDTGLAQEEFDLVELIAQIIINMEGKITARNLDVDVNIPQGELLVWGNRDGISQVCYNLLDNACKFALPESVLTVSLEVLDKKVHVSFENLGEPMTAEELPQLFQQFHKRDQSRRNDPEGLGLGLYIVKSILAKLQENISVTSVEGVTTFTFTLTLV